MRKIRVMVVDDAVVVRRIVTDVLAAEPDIEVVGTAANGRLALAKVAQLAPDLITLDIEMPDMDGLDTLVELRKMQPGLPVIMFSTLTERGATSTLEALARGATDYVTKPANVGSVTEGQERIRQDLIPRIRAICGRVVAPARLVPHPPVSAPRQPPMLPLRADLLAIGVSTGGPNALGMIIPALPRDFPLPIVIVQHMPPLFTRFLADRLSNASALSVREGEEGGLIEPGVVWVAPGGQHLTLRRVGDQVRIALNQDPPENSCRPAVDPLFRSVAQIYGNHALALILTGMGQDGLLGAGAIRAAGGRVLAQDEATAVVWGMPGAVVGAGLAELVLPLEQVAAALIQRAGVGRLPRVPGFPAPSSTPR